MSALPPRDWYSGWIEHHCAATGAGPEAKKLLGLAREIFTATWKADEIELLECTRRLITECRVPKFSNEHSDAIGKELKSVRADADKAALQRTREADTTCPKCSGSGWAEVPVVGCVWNGQLCTLRDRESGKDTGRILFASVSCDCPEGKRQETAEQMRVDRSKDAKRRISLAEYTARVRGADGPGMVAVYRKRQAERARADDSEADNPLSSVYASLKSKYGICPR